MENFASWWLGECFVVVLKKFGGKIVSLVQVFLSSNVAFRVLTYSQDNIIFKTSYYS
jgi:hypothetical protein